MDVDVAVIGASSAGLYAAERLARAGWRVGVFERREGIVPPRRTLIVTPQWSHLFTQVPETAVLHQVQVMAVATSGAVVRITLREPDLIIERRQFAQALARRAQEAGADLHYGHRFMAFDVGSKGVALCLRTADGRERTVHARAVIGADGPFSDVAAAAGIKRPPVVPILQAEIPLPSGWDPSVTKVWFDAQDTRFFYWLIPESSERGVLGLVGDHKVETRDLLARFLDRHDLEPLAYQGGLVAMHHPRLRPWGRVGNAPVLLVGDAAGQVKVTTVGGTVTGLWGAEAAVRSLLRGTSYARELRALKRELDLHWLLRVLLDRMDNVVYDRLVRCITPPVQRLLERYTRDELTKTFWRLLVFQPRLSLIGLQMLLRLASTRSRRAPEPYSMGDLPVRDSGG